MKTLLAYFNSNLSLSALEREIARHNTTERKIFSALNNGGLIK